MRARLGMVGVVLLSAVVLSACGSSSAAGPQLSGTPSLNISVPLSLSSCMSSDQCLALGTTGLEGNTTSAAQVTTTAGAWHAVTSPLAPSTLLSSASCWNNGCLIGGSNASGDVVWSYAANATAVSATSAPTAATGISVLNCFGADSCAAVDTSPFSGGSRWSETLNGGATWSTPINLAWSQNVTMTSLACTSATNCLLAGTLSQNGSTNTVLETTSDGGTTWQALTTKKSWHELASLSCHQSNCDALIDVGSTLVVAHSKNFGSSWHLLAGVSGEQPSALACISATKCVVVGSNTSGEAWIASVSNNAFTSYRLRYVPSALVDVSCGTKRCASVASGTVVVSTI